MRRLRRIVDIKSNDRVTTVEVLTRTQTPSLLTTFRQHRLGLSRSLHAGWLYGKLVSGKPAQGRPHLRFKDVCKRNMKSLDMDSERWETLACDRDKWKQKLRACLLRGKAQLRQAAEDKCSHQKNSQRLSTQKKSSTSASSATGTSIPMRACSATAGASLEPERIFYGADP